MSRAILVLVYALLVFSPASAPAQSQAVPHAGTLAEDYFYTMLVEKYCGHIVALDAVEVEELQNLTLTIMLDRHGEASTKNALDAALNRLSAEAEEDGLDSWCGYAATIIEARYPELLRE